MVIVAVGCLSLLALSGLATGFECDARSVAQAVEHAAKTGCTELEIKHVTFKAADMDRLATALAQNPTIVQQLELQDCAVSDDDIRSLFLVGRGNDSWQLAILSLLSKQLRAGFGFPR